MAKKKRLPTVVPQRSKKHFSFTILIGREEGQKMSKTEFGKGLNDILKGIEKCMDEENAKWCDIVAENSKGKSLKLKCVKGSRGEMKLSIWVKEKDGDLVPKRKLKQTANQKERAVDIFLDMLTSIHKNHSIETSTISFHMDPLSDCASESKNYPDGVLPFSTLSYR